MSAGEVRAATGVAAAKDLTRQEPRGLDEELEGYAWLPRMLDKARASLAGTAGSYQFGCPVDHTCMARLGIEPQLLLDLAARYADDHDVLHALRGHGIPPARDAWFDGQEVEDELQDTGSYLRVRAREALPRADGGWVFAGAAHGAGGSGVVSSGMVRRPRPEQQDGMPQPTVNPDKPLGRDKEPLVFILFPAADDQLLIFQRLNRNTQILVIADQRDLERLKQLPRLCRGIVRRPQRQAREQLHLQRLQPSGPGPIEDRSRCDGGAQCRKCDRASAPAKVNLRARQGRCLHDRRYVPAGCSRTRSSQTRGSRTRSSRTRLGTMV